MRKPNYNFERAERDRAKQAKAEAKAQRKAEIAAAEKAGQPIPPETEGEGETSDRG
ncbi:hypothetical protein [Roseomonas sp. BN140053]|uniref:hypothetical protein n=1 Tax=Roseomonas sp. BN140053 TaxID=3391898 RepID=UPI0039ED5A68